MVNRSKGIAIFVDTNTLQIFLSEKQNTTVALDKIEISAEYYKLINFIELNELQNIVEVCIPSIVVMEMKQHMYDCYNSKVLQIEKDMNSYQRIFGTLLEVEYSIKQQEDYSKFVDHLFKGFIDNPRNFCKIVQHGQEGLLDKLLQKALDGTKPFRRGKFNGKDGSDIGFKDSVIAETIYEYCERSGKIGIFVSKDQDFADAFERTLNEKSKYVIFNSFELATDALENYFETNPSKRIRKKFEDDKYLQERLLQEAEIKFDQSVTNITVKKVEKGEGEGVYNVSIDFIVNETIYHYNVEFDDNLNEIINCNYTVEND